MFQIEAAPIKLGPHTYYFHGDLWTAEELKDRWGIQANDLPSETRDAQSLMLTTAGN
ncbi:MAG TPA: hypothetical protein VK657_13180 [Terriglobales bacterium]|nr:hypothetical protein [Terriglobales bacterium]